MKPVDVTERQSVVLAFIEDELAVGRAVPNTTELSRHAGYSTGEIARVRYALEHMGFPGQQRNIRLCSPSVRMAPDEHLVVELPRRGYLVRRSIPQ